MLGFSVLRAVEISVAPRNRNFSPPLTSNFNFRIDTHIYLRIVKVILE